MAEDEFLKLFQHLHRIETKLDTSLENMATKDNIQQILNRLDSIEKQIEISEDERLVMGHQLTRLDKWIHELANKIDYKISV